MIHVCIYCHAVAHMDDSVPQICVFYTPHRNRLALTFYGFYYLRVQCFYIQLSLHTHTHTYTHKQHTYIHTLTNSQIAFKFSLFENVQSLVCLDILFF